MLYAQTVNIWYCIGVPFWLVVFITMIADLNEITEWQRSPRWILRRIGLLAAIAASATVIAKPFTTSAIAGHEITWVMPLIGFAWAMRVFTAPGQPPWAQRIWGDPPKENPPMNY
jgi:hypothetical protein